MNYYITGIRRGLGQRLWEEYGSVDKLEDCDVFINCKHDGFDQVKLLYRAAELNKRIINIGSNSPDESKKRPHIYQIEKFALDKGNEQLFYQGVNTTLIRFGWFDSPRVAHIAVRKMPISYCVSIIKWVLDQPHRVKEITVSP